MCTFTIGLTVYRLYLNSKDSIDDECAEHCGVGFIPSTDNMDGERSITHLKVEEKEEPDVSINKKEKEKEEYLMML